MKKTRKYVLLLTVFILLIGLLSACQPKPPKNWWQDVVFYEIFVRSFKDSNGDGIGDFNGIIEMLDYLNDGDPNTTDDLGIGGIWLMPINPSPSYHGYDVSDYKAVNPDYGTLEDFNNLIKECH
nr:alpha-amylase family glycosyl hydrolase [Anaerolineaceae bacterium]